jgi:hypothetical protein
MSKPNALRALDPLEYRFTDPEDAAKYGDGWYVYDESYWLRLRARDLIAMEGRLGMSLTSVMNGMRANTTLGDTAAAWLGLIAAGKTTTAGEFDDFNPVTNLIEWQEYEGKAEPVAEVTPPEPAPAQPDTHPLEDPDLPMAGRYRSTTSGPMDTVVLQNLPDAV